MTRKTKLDENRDNLFTKDCIRTYTGLYMNVFDPTPEMICIEDIAHALSHQCRFGGHLHTFYSVAQHSWLTSFFCPTNQFQALMHDASEAYLLDIPSPIKAHLLNYKEIENNLMNCIASKFAFKWPMEEDVKMTDAFMLQVEWNELHLRNGKTNYIEYRSPEEAKENFLIKFKELTRESRGV